VLKELGRKKRVTVQRKRVFSEAGICSLSAFVLAFVLSLALTVRAQGQTPDEIQIDPESRPIDHTNRSGVKDDRLAPEQEKNVRKAIEFLRRMGDPDADELEGKLNRGEIRSGPENTFDGDTIILYLLKKEWSDEYLQQIAAIASTLKHELFHIRNHSWDYRLCSGAKFAICVGKHSSEVEAWYYTITLARDWININGQEIRAAITGINQLIAQFNNLIATLAGKECLTEEDVAALNGLADQLLDALNDLEKLLHEREELLGLLAYLLSDLTLNDYEKGDYLRDHIFGDGKTLPQKIQDNRNWIGGIKGAIEDLRDLINSWKQGAKVCNPPPDLPGPGELNTLPADLDMPGPELDQILKAVTDSRLGWEGLDNVQKFEVFMPLFDAAASYVSAAYPPNCTADINLDIDLDLTFPVIVTRGVLGLVYSEGGSILSPDVILELKERDIHEILIVDDPSAKFGELVSSGRIIVILVVDDMESYHDEYDPIWDTWVDGYRNDTGSWIELGIDPCNPVHGGIQSMVYDYDNNSPMLWVEYTYSETERTFSDPCDWTAFGVKALTLFFYGDPNNDTNDTEQMYLGVEDSCGLYAEIRYGQYYPENEDMNNLKLGQWQRWDIALAHFNDPSYAGVANDVNLAAIAKLYLGFGDRRNPVPGGSGTVYFDDIRLYIPRCILAHRPDHLATVDLSGDCVVDFADIRITVLDWLMTDGYLFPSPPGPAAGWWKLDEGGGNTATDSSVHANQGTITGDYAWVEGHDGGYALDFVEGIVRVPDAAHLRPSAQVSASAWVNYSEEQHSTAAIVVKGADDKETFALEVDPDNEFAFYVRDVNGIRYRARAVLYPGDWVHLAGTYDGWAVKCYVNGQLEDSRDEAKGIPLSQDTNDLGVGSRPCDEGRPFCGTIDDVRVYNYALSETEILYIGGWDAVYVPLESPANIYDQEVPGYRAVNFRDFAVLVERWLDKAYWP
jgi:hypothetical protein